mmetsp:Transcript_3122/g.8897  ORF Transcript_3122/g.8897 Transcript_3122/m.8897 type:complete len:303 (+) Transcript_3122:182-1090(+)
MASWFGGLDSASKQAGSRHVALRNVPEEANIVRIKLHSAEKVPVADLNGTSDPYVKFTLGEKVGISTTVPKNLNPHWLPAESFSFFFLDDDDAVTIELYDADRFNADDRLGASIIMLSDYNEDETPVALDIVDPETGLPVEGCKIHLDITVMPRDKFFHELEFLCWEYERLNPHWGTNFLMTDPEGGKCAYSNYDSSKFVMNPDESVAEDELEVAGDIIKHWHVVNSLTGSDDNGYQYAPDLNGNIFTGWSVQPGPLSYVRRRLWRKVVKMNADGKEEAAAAEGEAATAEAAEGDKIEDKEA